MKNPIIRDFEERDYEPLCALANRIAPERTETGAEWRYHDGRRHPECAWRRWVVEEDGRLIAWSEYLQIAGTGGQAEFSLDLGVDPAYQGAGLGHRLYQMLMDALVALRPAALYADTRENRPLAVSFLERRGFVEVMRLRESYLDLLTYEPGRHAGAIRRLLDQGIHICSARDLAGHPDWARHLYDLDQEVKADIPAATPFVRDPFETWVTRFTASPGYLPDGYLVAQDGERCVGQTVLWRDGVHGHLSTGTTGVLRAYRRRGIALALKAASLQFAQNAGFVAVRTHNATRNDGMLAINDRLGFQAKPAWVRFRKAETTKPPSPVG